MVLQSYLAEGTIVRNKELPLFIHAQINDTILLRKTQLETHYMVKLETSGACWYKGKIVARIIVWPAHPHIHPHTEGEECDWRDSQITKHSKNRLKHSFPY